MANTSVKPGPSTEATTDKWLFTAEQLINSPSKQAGISACQELLFRQQAANLIQCTGQQVNVSQLCINTAIVYMHRFYAFHPFTVFHRNGIAQASLFLAAKVENQPRKFEYIIREAHKCLQLPEPTKEQFAELAQDLLFNEIVLLQTLGYDVSVEHPHSHVVTTCHLVKASKELAQTSYFMASNSLHLTTMCLQYKPTVVACFCIHLACKWSRWEIQKSTEGKEWFHYIDKTVSLELLQKLTDEFLRIFDLYPSKLKCKMKSLSALVQTQALVKSGSVGILSQSTLELSRHQSATTTLQRHNDHYNTQNSVPVSGSHKQTIHSGKSSSNREHSHRPTPTINQHSRHSGGNNIPHKSSSSTQNSLPNSTNNFIQSTDRNPQLKPTNHSTVHVNKTDQCHLRKDPNKISQKPSELIKSINMKSDQMQNAAKSQHFSSSSAVSHQTHKIEPESQQQKNIAESLKLIDDINRILNNQLQLQQQTAKQSESEKIKPITRTISNPSAESMNRMNSALRNSVIVKQEIDGPSSKNCNQSATSHNNTNNLMNFAAPVMNRSKHKLTNVVHPTLTQKRSFNKVNQECSLDWHREPKMRRMDSNYYDMMCDKSNNNKPSTITSSESYENLEILLGNIHGLETPTEGVRSMMSDISIENRNGSTFNPKSLPLKPAATVVSSNYNTTSNQFVSNISVPNT